MQLSTMKMIVDFVEADYVVVSTGDEQIVGHARNLVSALHDGFDFEPTRDSRFWITPLRGMGERFVSVRDVQAVSVVTKDEARAYADFVAAGR